MNRRQALLMAIFLLLISYVCPVAFGQEYVVEPDIRYGLVEGTELLLDLARPAKGNGPFPALVFIHGLMGHRTYYYPQIILAAKRGYVAVTIDYLTPLVTGDGKFKNTFPAVIAGDKCAVRWLRANATKYNIDTNHLGAIGWSAGGHQALILGFTDPSDGLEGNCGDLSYSSRVQAVVNIAGQANLTGAAGGEKTLIGGTFDQMPEKYRQASPLTYVSNDDPPVLTLHGDKDTTVPVEQALLLDQKMKEVGVPHILIITKGGGHYAPSSFFEEYYPLWDFLDKYLKPNTEHR